MSTNKDIKIKEIKTFSQALNFINALVKKNEFIDALLAIKELEIKNNLVIQYNENLNKQLSSLSMSNIKEVELKAKEKQKKVDKILDNAHKRSAKLEEISTLIRNTQQETVKKNQELEKKQKFDAVVKEINKLLKIRETKKALNIATKLITEYPESKKPLKLLKKIEDLIKKEKIKQEKEWFKEEKLNKMFEDLGVDKEVFENLNDPRNYWKNFIKWIGVISKKNKIKAEELKNTELLKKMEKMLTRAWTINNLMLDDAEQVNIWNSIKDKLSKNLNEFEIPWYDFVWKILGKDKITWDTFWFHKEQDRIVFYLWDATWHWIQAWMTVSLLSKLFYDYISKIKDFQELFTKINNDFKAKINWKVFLSWIFFEYSKQSNTISYIWAWHNPMLVYRKNTWAIEKIIPGWLILWFRNIVNSASTRAKNIDLDDWDILITYTDWIVEYKNAKWEIYWLENFIIDIWNILKKYNWISTPKLFEKIMEKINDFSLWEEPLDDISLFILQRNKNKDVIKAEEEIEEIKKELEISDKKDNKFFKNKSKQQIIEDLKKEKYNSNLKVRLNRLDKLYRIWEFIKLKQEVNLYIKEWYIHPKMEFYLKKAIDNEHIVWLKKIDEKLQKRYDILVSLYKKWEYELVVKDIIDILYRNWKI